MIFPKIQRSSGRDKECGGMTEKEERLKPQESFFRIVDYLIEEAHFQVKKTEGVS